MNSGDPDFRPDLYLVARIIDALSNDSELNKTNLAVETGFAYNRLINYLEWMEVHQLVQELDGKVSLTEKGRETYLRLVDWILEYVGKLNFPKKRN